MPSAGISGVGVSIAAGGGLLVYAGLRGVNPLTAVRDIASGHPLGVPNVKGSRTATVGSGDTVIQGHIERTGYPPLLGAFQMFQADKYSQARRWSEGYSDCSSIFGKSFKALGIKPPGSSTTYEYLAWSSLKKISHFQAGPGDILLSTSHMAIVVDATTAEGQQNPRENVRTGTWPDIMYPGDFGVYRYSPPNPTVSV